MGQVESSVFADAAILDASNFEARTWRHAVALHAYLSRRAGGVVADDLLGEVFVRAFASRATYDAALGDTRPWLFGIARHVLHAHWRAFGRPAAPVESAIADPWPDIDSQLDAFADRGRLAAALDELTDEEREVLLLVAWEGLSQLEISIVLGVPYATVRTRLHRARVAMRSRIGATSVSLDAAKEL